MGLERRPGNDPGLRRCAAAVCPLHSAHIGGLVCPGTPVGSRHGKIRKGGSRRPGTRTPLPASCVAAEVPCACDIRGERSRTALL